MRKDSIISDHVGQININYPDHPTYKDAKLNKDFASMNSSVNLINDIINGSRKLDETSDNTKARVEQFMPLEI